MRKKILSLFTLFIVWLFIFPKYSLASSITFSSSQTSILAPDEEFVVNVNLSVSTSNSTVYYLRGEFYQQGISSYCGFTWNGTGWYNGPYTSNGWVNLLPVSIQSNSWAGQIRAKIDLGDAGCATSGDYNFRVQRYTSSGSVSSDTETPLVVIVSVPTPSPTPSPTPTPSPSPSPTQVSSKAVYKINKSKDNAGLELTSVQIYVDGQYIHHVDDEIMEFYSGNECYLGVSCSFGNHTISLRKNGYSNWEETRDFLAGISFEVSPVLDKQTTVSSTPSPSLSATPTKTSTPIPTKTPIPTPTNSPVEEILGAETIFPSQSPEGIQDTAPENTKNTFPFLAVGIIALGLGFIGFSIFTIIKNAKKSYTIESENKNNQIF